jgi:excisionase family DNA binding protein
MQKKYLSIDDTVEYTNLCKSTISRLSRSRDFYPARRIGRRVLIDRELLDQWISEQSN